MSAKVLSDSEHIQGIEDDRESAFYVLTWTALKYSRHDLLKDFKFILDIYEEVYTVDGRSEGGRLKRDMLTQSFPVKFSNSRLNALIQEIRNVLAVRYKEALTDVLIEVYNRMLKANPEDAIHNPVHTIMEAKQRISRPSWLVETFRRHLGFDDWPEDDKAEKNPMMDRKRSVDSSYRQSWTSERKRLKLDSGSNQSGR
jgi:hypothetical protein